MTRIYETCGVIPDYKINPNNATEIPSIFGIQTDQWVFQNSCF